MIVCHCKAVSDREIRDLVSQGHDTKRKLGRQCQAGRVCGGCRPVIDEILDDMSEPGTALVGLELSPAR